MLAVSLVAGLAMLTLAQGIDMPGALLLAGVAALVGTAAELFSPGEYDTVTVPVAITATLLLMQSWMR